MAVGNDTCVQKSCWTSKETGLWSWQCHHGRSPYRMNRFFGSIPTYLKLCSHTPVLRHYRPIVSPLPTGTVSCCQHRFNRKDHTGLEFQLVLVAIVLLRYMYIYKFRVRVGVGRDKQMYIQTRTPFFHCRQSCFTRYIHTSGTKIQNNFLTGVIQHIHIVFSPFYLSCSNLYTKTPLYFYLHFKI